jgi:hypothetical protein
VLYEEFCSRDGDCDGLGSKLVVDVASVTDSAMRGVGEEEECWFKYLPKGPVPLPGTTILRAAS